MVGLLLPEQGMLESMASASEQQPPGRVPISATVGIWSRHRARPCWCSISDIEPILPLSLEQNLWHDPILPHTGTARPHLTVWIAEMLAANIASNSERLLRILGSIMFSFLFLLLERMAGTYQLPWI